MVSSPPSASGLARVRIGKCVPNCCAVPNRSKVSLSWSPTIHAYDKENAPLIVSQIILDVLGELIMTYPKSTEKRRIELRSIKKMTYKSRAGLALT